MPVSTPTVSGATCSEGFLPQNRVSSNFKINGGPRVPDAAMFGVYPVVYVTNDDQTIPYTLYTFPQYSGQLIWSNTIGTTTTFSVTKGRARLFVAMPATGFSVTGFVWVPVIPTAADVVLNADTGKPMDYLGEYTCNPPWLCRG